MSEFKAIVVGAGGISNAWFPPLKAEGVRVMAVADLRLDAAKSQIEKYELDAVASDDLEGVLSCIEADFVVDLTIPEAHCGVTCRALEAGFHVIGEKPMASSMEEARRMVRTARETGRLYLVSQSRRWNPLHDSIRKTVESGLLGTLTTVNCDFYIGAHFGGFRDEMASPLVLDMLIHQFDLARMMSGKDPVSVFAEEFNPHGSWYKGDAAANCLFRMTDGVHFALRGSWCAEGFPTSWNGNWRLVGDRGTLLYEQDQPPRVQVAKEGEEFMRELEDIEPVASDLELQTMHGALREMLEFLETGRRPQTECTDNIRSLAMVFAAMESSRQDRRVPVKA